jgi:hypothetical protein
MALQKFDVFMELPIRYRPARAETARPTSVSDQQCQQDAASAAAPTATPAAAAPQG